MLYSKLQADLIDAMKSGDAAKRDLLRMLQSNLKNLVINQKLELNDEVVIRQLRKEIKSRQDSITAFESANRHELVAKEAAEIALIEPYLPAEIDDSLVQARIKELISEHQLSGPSSLGRLIGLLKQEYGEGVNPARLAELAKTALSIEQT